jgi:hypothetical protein
MRHIGGCALSTGGEVCESEWRVVTRSAVAWERISDG